MNPIFTIGHSIHPIEHFVALLQRHAVTAIADVRSTPYSRRSPAYNRETLDATLRMAGIRYVFLGRELGARSDDPACYDHGRVQYSRLANTDLFKSGIDRLLKGAETQTIAMMCAEKDPLFCHRTLLVTRALLARGILVQHILADGGIEPHAAAMDRLLHLLKMSEPTLPFEGGEDRLSDAYARQEERIAYVRDQAPDDQDTEEQ